MSHSPVFPTLDVDLKAFVPGAPSIPAIHVLVARCCTSSLFHPFLTPHSLTALCHSQNKSLSVVDKKGASLAEGQSLENELQRLFGSLAATSS